MSGTLRMEVRGADQWALVLRRLQQETRRNAFDALTYAGVKIAVSGRKMAKPGDKRRTVERNPDFRRMVRERRKWARAMGVSSSGLGAQKIFPHYIMAYQQRRRDPVKLGTFNPQADPRRQIENRGLAQKMWNILWGQLASLKGQGNASQESGAAAIKRTVTANATRYTVNLNMAVRLNYLEAAYPGIGQKAVENGRAALFHELERRQQMSLARANRKAA
jgi:hypothetical protein